VAQGVSEHITGNGLDLKLDTKVTNSSANAQSGTFNNLPAYQWFKANAKDFGLNAYAREPWHWSYHVKGE
jgi:LAS superfamily LD-carboxypeptidase LdcB